MRAEHRISQSIKLSCKILPVLLATCFSCIPAWANPTGAQVVSGQVAISNNGNVLTITNSPGSIINWQSFSINPGQLTQFLQQSASSTVLNRIVGQNPSQIFGALQSNGKVYLINPNGILFGAGSQVNVGGLVASSLDISNADFSAGKLDFNQTTTAATSSVINQGTISTPGGGNIYLIAPQVQNTGIITSSQGEVLLAAGHSVQLVDGGDPNLQVVISAPADAALNLGKVLAQGGKIGIYGALVNQNGIVNADSAVVGQNGEIVFKASGTTTLSGNSQTTATGGGNGSGGNIYVLGNQVQLTGNAQVDASGQSGGGTVLVGGDSHGTNPAIQNAATTFVGADTLIATDALQSGNGGKVVIWSQNDTSAFGSISARGGAQGGNGGFVETSGHDLDVNGIHVNASAAKGSAGTWLLDPYDVTIGAGTDNSTCSGNNTVTCSGPSNPGGSSSILLLASTVSSILNGGTDVIVNTTGDGNGFNQGSITVAAPIAWTSANTLTLAADTDIFINASINGINSGGAGSLVMQAGRNIIQSLGNPISVVNLTAMAGLGSTALSVPAGTGLVVLTEPGNNVTGTIAGSGPQGFSFTNSGSIFVGATGGASGIASSNGTINLTALTGDITQDVTSATAITGFALYAGALASDPSSGTVALTNQYNAVSTLAGTAAGAGGFSFTNTESLTVGMVSYGISSTNQTPSSASQAGVVSTGAGPVSLAVTGSIGNVLDVNMTGASGSVLINGTTYPTGIIAADGTQGYPVTLASSGAVTTTNGTISGSALQINAETGIGTASVPLNTSVNSLQLMNGAFSGDSNASGDINISNSAVDLTINGPGVQQYAPTGNVTIGTATANFITVDGGSVTAQNGAITISGQSDVVLANGGSISTGGGAINLFGDTMSLSAGTLNANSGLIWLQPFTPGTPIYLGSGSSGLVLSADVLGVVDSVLTAGTLRIGSTASGPIVVDMPIAPIPATLSLQSGGTITQTTGSSITATSLAINSLGSATLDTATNFVSTIAASIGGTTPGVNVNGDFTFKNGQALTIANDIDNVGGIGINGDAAAFNPSSPNGFIALTTTAGAITRAGGANLGAKALALNGYAGVSLQNSSNSIGVISGSTSTGDFQYTSINGISVTTVDGTTGIIVGAGHNILLETSSVSGISQTTGATLSTPGGELALSSAGPVVLTESGNNVSYLAASTVGNFSFKNSSALTVKDQYGILGSPGIATQGGEAVINTGANALSITEPINTTVGLDPGNVILTAANITQSGSGIITGQGLAVISSGTVNLTLQNVLSTFAGSTTGGGNISFDNAADFNIGSVSGGALAGGLVLTGVASSGAVDLNSTTNTMTVNASINAAGNVGLTANQIIGGAGTVTGTSLSATAPNGVGSNGSPLLTDLGTLNSATATAGGVFINNSSAALHIDNLTAGGGNVNVNNIYSGSSLFIGDISASGSINVTSAGSLTTFAPDSPSAIVGASVTMMSQGVMSAPAGSITATAGPIALYAGYDGTTYLATNNTLTTGGSLSASTTVDLYAGGIINSGATGTPPATTHPSLYVAISSSPPTLSQCIAAPTTAGCAAVLPTLAQCTVTPTTAGCTVVLPTIAQCTAMPTAAGCMAVLPTIAQCTATPTTASCTAVLPTIAQCTATPTAAGCTAVLPTIAQCTATPTAVGCAAVLPTIAQCTMTPTAAGCTAVLPTIAQCTATPTAAGCAAVLPTIAQCTTMPTTAGCAAVLPTIAQCTTTPTAAGCVAVLPTIAQCTAMPTAAGCVAVLPTIAQCTAMPTAAGCAAVLPTIAQCTATPTLAGCSAILPSLAQCALNPALAGCSTPTPPSSQIGSSEGVQQISDVSIASLNISIDTLLSGLNQGGSAGAQGSTEAGGSDSSKSDSNSSMTNIGATSNVTPKKLYCN